MGKVWWPGECGRWCESLKKRKNWEINVKKGVAEGGKKMGLATHLIQGKCWQLPATQYSSGPDTYFPTSEFSGNQVA